MPGPADRRDARAALPPGITDTRGWTEERVRKELERVRTALGWDQTTGSARKWWEAFETENRRRLPLVLRLAEELRNRRATITEFFLAYVYSNTDNLQANLHYLDYTRLKKEEAGKKRAGRAPQPPAAPPNPARPPPKRTRRKTMTSIWSESGICTAASRTKVHTPPCGAGFNATLRRCIRRRAAQRRIAVRHAPPRPLLRAVRPDLGKPRRQARRKAAYIAPALPENRVRQSALVLRCARPVFGAGWLPR